MRVVYKDITDKIDDEIQKAQEIGEVIDRIYISEAEFNKLVELMYIVYGNVFVYVTGLGRRMLQYNKVTILTELPNESNI